MAVGKKGKTSEIDLLNDWDEAYKATKVMCKKYKSGERRHQKETAAASKLLDASEGDGIQLTSSKSIEIFKVFEAKKRTAIPLRVTFPRGTPNVSNLRLQLSREVHGIHYREI